MAIEVTMPQMGADMTEGTLVHWLKEVGDHVERGEVLAEIETDKATVELEAYESGELLKLVVGEGDVVPVGQVIALIGLPNETVPDVDRLPAASTPARRVVDSGAVRTPELMAAETGPAPRPITERTHAPATVPSLNGSVPAPEGRLRISPVAKRIALEAGIDVRDLAGSGPDGRILRRDVEALLTSASQPALPAPAPAAPRPAAPAAAATAPTGSVETLSKMRQAIARRMTQSKQLQPHYYLTLDIDMTEALSFRQQINGAATETQRVSINDMIVKACAIALQRHPKFNAEFSENGLVHHTQVNIDIGIALDEGLIAPAILDCGSKSLGRIAEEAKDLIERAKSGRLTADEYSAGTFTITNLGAFGVETLIGIINPPQAAILGVGSVMPQAVVRDDQVVVRQVMKIALSADHRVSDGAEGARFIKEIQGLLENPLRLAL